jgi:hypothetical protein
MLAIVYASFAMRYALISLINLLTLAVGITIGVLLAPHVERHVQAEEGQAQSQSAGQGQPAGQEPTNGPEQIQPTITAGSIGAYLLLAHHVQSDELVVNGIDVLKLEQGELNLISSLPGVPSWRIQQIVDGAKASHLYQVASPKPPQPTK